MKWELENWMLVGQEMSHDDTKKMGQINSDF